MSQLKKLLTRVSGAGTSPLQTSVDALNNHIRLNGNTGFQSKEASGFALGLEEYVGEAQYGAELGNSLKQLEQVIAGLSKPGLEEYSPAQREAAAMAGSIASNMQAFIHDSRPIDTKAMPASNGIGRIKPALESYDEKENKAAAVYTVAYNLQAARQDPFGEAFYPTVVVPPDQQGYHIHINLVNLISGVRRSASGALDSWNRHNIVHVIRNPGLINSNSTVLIPVFREGSKENFVDEALVGTSTVDVNGETVTTSYLAIDKQFDLIGNSQTDTQLDVGHMDETDSVDTDIQMKNLLIKVGNDVMSFPTTHIPGAQFVYPITGDQQRMDVRMDTDALLISAKSLKVNGAALTTLKPLVDANLNVYVKTTITGSVVRDKGQTEINASPVRVAKIIDENGEVHTATSQQMAAIVALFAGAQVIGYKLNARRTNLNRRSIGQMLETRQDVQAYAVPLLSPFTIKRPQGLNDSTDASDLASLVTLTRAMASGMAVDELFKAAETLKSLVQDGRRPLGDNLAVLGIAHHIITATYFYREIKIDDLVQSLESTGMAENVQAAFFNTIRDLVYRAYQDSGYRAAADMLAGGESAKPTVIIGTDMTTARWLTVNGDLRLIGSGFDDCVIVDTQNEKMRNKIFITFGVKGASDGVPHPLHFGNMAWKPEVTVVLPIYRNGASNKELTVQPSFRHVTNLPILIEIDVSGVPETFEARVPVAITGEMNTTDVTPVAPTTP